MNQHDRLELQQRIKDRYNHNTRTECWEYGLAIRPNGYARMTFRRKSLYAHRASYEAFKGDIPPGMDVCHCCDNRCCVNPDHLFIGTRKDNMQDAVSKNRQAKGFALPQTKLTAFLRQEIASMVNQGLSKDQIASQFGISKPYVNQIARNNGDYRKHGIGK